MKRTFQPSKKRRVRQHGFLARTRTKKGRATLRRRRWKGRIRMAGRNTKHKFKRHTRS